MTVTGDSQAQFSELDQLELSEYRPLNRAALGTFILGCLSAISLVHPGLIVIPILTVFMAVIALRQLQSAELKQSGRALATIGLYVAALFGSWTGFHHLTRSAHLYHQAQAFAEQWLNLLREGKAYEAHQLLVRESERVAPGTSLEQHYSLEAAEEHRLQSEKMARIRSADESEPPMEMDEMMGPPPRDNFNQYFNDPLPKRLREMGRDARINFLTRVQLVPVGSDEIVIELIFEIVPGNGSNSRSFPVAITLQRTVPPGLTADWHVSRVHDPNAK